MGEDRRADVRRSTVAEAAEILGISAEAVRGRVRRGTLPIEREGGKVYVLLDQPPPDRTTGDQPSTTGDRMADRTELVEDLRGQVEYLRRQLDQEREARTEERRRHDTLMAQLTQANAVLAARLPELEAPAPPGPRGGPQTAAEASEGAGPRSATGEAQEGTQRPQAPRSLWSRIFGGS